MTDQFRPFFRVIDKGIYSSFQDLGRQHCQHFGFSTTGAMDQSSMRVANRLCKNHDNACVIEIVLGGLELEVLSDSQIAVTGGAAAIWVNGLRCSSWALINLKIGDRLKLGYCTSGFRLYLAIVGGFQTQMLFGSRSVVKHELQSGLYGMSIEEEALLYASITKTIALTALRYRDRPFFLKRLCVHVILGFQVGWFSKEAIDAFFSTAFQVSTNSDRMAYRLKGAAVKCPMKTLYSEPVFPGVIQIPPDGFPIIMMREHQTLGGYPKVGVVAQVDHDALAQLPVGGELYFKAVSVEEASILLAEKACRDKGIAFSLLVNE